MSIDPIDKVRAELAQLEEEKRQAYEQIQELSSKIAELYSQERKLMQQRDTSG